MEEKQKVNYMLVQEGFSILLPQLAHYERQEIKRVYKNKWWDQVRLTLDDEYKNLPTSGKDEELLDSLDIMKCLKLITRMWSSVFKDKMPINDKTWATELMGVRHDASHIGSKDFEQEYAERALDTMALFCDEVNPKSAEKIRALYRKLRYGSEEGSKAASENAAIAKSSKKRTSAAVLTKSVGNNLPSWRDVIQPHPDVAEGRYKTAEFAADLAQVARGEGAYEYRDPVEFFSRTYLTEGMTGLLVESLERIANKGGEPVIQLKTAFGGGKTHSMLALYHMLQGKPSIGSISELKPVMERAGLSKLPKANIAVLVGTALDPSKKKNPPNFPGYTVSTIWGEMAFQLVTTAGKPELYEKYIREADRKGVAPGSENLKNLFDECGPCLILMDEMVAYGKKLYGVDGLPAGSYDNFITFVQEITEAARASKNSLVVAAIPESEIEIGGEAGKKVLETIEHTFGRMESVWKPVAADEGFEVVRRRLFLKCKDPSARDIVCEAFSEMYNENPTDFPFETKELTYKERLVSCYPIHPEVFDRLYGDWATLENFQRTRGVLRLMAAVIHELWMADDASAMIMPGSIPLDTPHVRDELVRHLPDTWNSIIDREVDGKESIPYQEDEKINRYGQNLACRRVARTIMLGSAPSTSALRDQGIRGLEISRILLGTVQPGENIANFRDALNTLYGSLTYLYNSPNGDRFWYDTKPTLRKTAEDRATQVSPADVEVEIESRLRKIRKESPFAGINACPATSNDVPDEQAVRLVILRPQNTYKRNSANCEAKRCVEDIFNNHGTSPRIYRNMIVFVAPDLDKIASLESSVKDFLAWTSIMSDKDDLNLDGKQVRDTDSSIARCNNTVDSRLKETYCWLMVPFIDQDEDMRKVQWDISNLGGGSESIVSKAAAKMIQSEQIITKWAPAPLWMCLDELLWRETDDISIKKLWEYLSTYCYLPRLSRYDVLEDAILQGVASKEYFAIAAAYLDNRYVDLRYNQRIVSFNQTDLLVKVYIAKKQIEAEREQDSAEGWNDGETKDGGDGFNSADEGNGESSGENTTGDSVEDAGPSNKYFHMSVKLDNTRVNRDINNYLQEVIRHLMEVDGADVDMTLDVEVSSTNGIPTETVRTVSENCRTLKITDFEFGD